MQRNAVFLHLGVAARFRRQIQRDLSRHSLLHHVEHCAAGRQIGLTVVDTQRVGGVLDQRPDMRLFHVEAHELFHDVDHLVRLEEAEIGRPVQTVGIASGVPLGHGNLRIGDLFAPCLVGFVQEKAALALVHLTARINMHRHLIDGRTFCFGIEFREDHFVGDMGPVDGTRAVKAVCAKVQVVGRVEVGKDVRARHVGAVVIRQAREIEIGAGLHDDFGIRVLQAEFIIDDHGHFAGKAAVLDRRHLATTPVFIAQLERFDLGGAVHTVDHVADEPAQSVFVNGSKAVAIGVGGLGQQVARRNNDGDGQAFFTGIIQRLVQRNEFAQFAGVPICDNGRVGICDVEIAFGERPTGIPERSDTQLFDQAIIISALFQCRAGRKHVCAKKSLAGLRPHKSIGVDFRHKCGIRMSR